MIKLGKYKYIISAFAVTVVLSSAFCASYAKWVGYDSTIAASAGVGQWQDGEPTVPPSGMGYYDADGNFNALETDFGFMGYSAVFYVLPSCESQKVYFSLNGSDYGNLTCNDATGTVKKDGNAFIINVGGGVMEYQVSMFYYPDGGGVMEYQVSMFYYPDGGGVITFDLFRGNSHDEIDKVYRL